MITSGFFSFSFSRHSKQNKRKKNELTNFICFILYTFCVWSHPCCLTNKSIDLPHLTPYTHTLTYKLVHNTLNPVKNASVITPNLKKTQLLNFFHGVGLRFAFPHTVPTSIVFVYKHRNHLDGAAPLGPNTEKVVMR